MYKISICVPMYNVEEFLKEAIKSLKNQTIGFENIEVILVDDCSTDKTGKIAQEYAEQYKNIIYYKLPENSGMAGKPRNIAIKMATAKYIMFLDPDDFYLDNACELMYNCIEKQKVPFVTTNLKDVDIHGNDLNRIHINEQEFKSQKIDINNIELALKVMKHSCPTKIINKEFLIKNNIYFLEGVPAEDAYFTSKMFLIAREAYYQSKPILCYRRRTTGNLSETNCLNKKFFQKMIKANKEIYYLFKQYNEPQYYKYYYIDTIIYLLRKLIISKELDSEEKAEIIMEMKDLIQYWNNSKLPTKLEKDTYEIIKLFKGKNKKEIKLQIEQSEEKMQKDEINVVRKNERELLSEIENHIRKGYYV